MSEEERLELEDRARRHAMSFDRFHVFDTLFPGAAAASAPTAPRQIRTGADLYTA
jgi:hypothetical protein